MDGRDDAQQVGAALRLAHLLARDPDHARHLVVEVLLTRPDDVVGATACAWVAGRGRTRAPVVVRVDGGAVVDAGDLWDRLALLPRAQQAALVLRHGLGRGPAEVAALLVRNEGDLRVAEAALGDPGPDTLAELFGTHAEGAPDAAGLPAALFGARTSRRRRRIVAVTLAAAAVLAAVAVSAAPRVVAGRAVAVPLASPPEYQNGGRLVGVAESDGGSTSVTFTPTGTAVTLVPACLDVTAIVSAAVGDSGGVLFGGCNGSYTIDPRSTASTVPSGGPATVTLTRTSGVGAVQLSVYQGVPRADYVFPPRPDVLADAPVQGALLTSAATAGANGATTAVVVATATSQLFLGTSAPGVVAVSVDGVALGSSETWDWGPSVHVVDLSVADLAAHGVRVVAGQPVTVQLVTSGFTAPGWAVSTQ